MDTFICQSFNNEEEIENQINNEEEIENQINNEEEIENHINNEEEIDLHLYKNLLKMTFASNQSFI